MDCNCTRLNSFEAAPVETCNKTENMIVNKQRKLMKLSRFPALWIVTMLAMGICISKGQTNGPVSQNGPRPAPGNGVRPNNVRPNNSNAPRFARGPANVGQTPARVLPSQMQNQPPSNFRANYPRSPQQSNPRLATARIQPQLRIDNVRPSADLLLGSGIVQTPLSMAEDQRAASADNPKPAT